MQVEHDLDLGAVKSVEFLFKQKKTEYAPAIAIKTYPGEVSERDGAFHIPFSEAETRRFTENADFYCDPKITLVDGSIPATEIMTLHCNPTLWGERDD